MRVAQKYFAPMELKSLQIWFSLPDKRLISNWFRYIVFKRYALTIRRFLDWGGAAHKLLTLFKIARAWFNQQGHKPYH